MVQQQHGHHWLPQPVVLRLSESKSPSVSFVGQAVPDLLTPECSLDLEGDGEAFCAAPEGEPARFAVAIAHQEDAEVREITSVAISEARSPLGGELCDFRWHLCTNTCRAIRQ